MTPVVQSASPINPRAALLRDESGAIVGATCGDTACWHPRRPGNYVSFNQDGDEVAIRCRDCAGCREFERRYLARRLAEHFKAVEGELWELQIACGLSEQSNICSRLNHSRIGPSLRGWCRAGADGVALIVSGSNPQMLVPRSVATRVAGWKRIRLKRGRRAFAGLTAGMVRSRAEYGEQVNRFYFRGVQPLPREFTWSKPSGFGRGIRKRHRISDVGASMRARREGISVHAPEAVAVALAGSRRARPVLRQSKGLATIGDILGGLISGSPVLAAPRSGVQLSARGPGRDALLDRVAGRDNQNPAARVARPYSRLADADLNSIKGSGYSSSRSLLTSEAAAWAARMAEIARKRGGGDDG